MACHLVDAKPLSEPMLEYCHLDPWKQTLIEIETFSFKKMHLNMSSGKMVAILSGPHWVNAFATKHKTCIENDVVDLWSAVKF